MLAEEVPEAAEEIRRPPPRAQAQAAREAIQRRLRLQTDVELRQPQELPVQITEVQHRLRQQTDAELRQQQELPVRILQTELLLKMQEAKHKLKRREAKRRLRETRLLSRVRIQGRNTAIRAEHIRQHILLREQTPDLHITTADRLHLKAAAAVLFQLRQDVQTQEVLRAHTERLPALTQDRRLRAVLQVIQVRLGQVHQDHHLPDLLPAADLPVRHHHLLHRHHRAEDRVN